MTPCPAPLAVSGRVPSGEAPPPTPPLAERRQAFVRLGYGLARIRRWNGASGITVAQHLVHACDMALAPVKPHALLHDCEEWRTGDLPTPLKERLRALGLWQRVEAEIVSPIHRHYSQLAGIGWPWPDPITAAVEDIDRRLLATEYRDAVERSALAVDASGVMEEAAPYEWCCHPWTARQAAALFVERALLVLPGLKGESR